MFDRFWRGNGTDRFLNKYYIRVSGLVKTFFCSSTDKSYLHALTELQALPFWQGFTEIFIYFVEISIAFREHMW